MRPRVPLVLGLVLLLAGLGLTYGAYASDRDQRSGTPGTAKVSSCSGHDGRYDTGVHCTGSWVVGGGPLHGGEVVIGNITNADRGDLGKTIDVRIHGDGHATKPSARTPIILAALGIPMLAIGAYLLLLRFRRPRRVSASVSATAPVRATTEDTVATPEDMVATPEDGVATPDTPFDIPAGDADLAGFYRAVFGWRATTDGALTTADGTVVARLREDVPAESDSVIGKVRVDDIHGTLGRARQAGGSTRGTPALSSDALFAFAILYDPRDNPVAVFTPSPHRDGADFDVPALLAAGEWSATVDAVDRLWPSGAGEDPYGDNIERKAAWWEAQGDQLQSVEPYEEAARLLSAYAAGATSGGEGYARMQDVHRVAAKLTALRTQRAR